MKKSAYKPMFTEETKAMSNIDYSQADDTIVNNHNILNTQPFPKYGYNQEWC